MPKKLNRLYTSFQPEHYELLLSPDPVTMHMTGTVTITGKKVGRPSQRLTFHQKGLKVTKATITKQDKKGAAEILVSRINTQNSYDEVRVHTDASLYAGTYTVHMEFETTITDAMHGVYPCYYQLDGERKQLIATQFESHHAREAFPCIDEPEAKATFDLTVISPVGEVVLGNTPVKTQQETDSQLVTTFETSPKMSTYLLAFAFGDLQSAETRTKDGVDVRIWSTKAHPKTALSFAAETAKRSIEFFNDYFGIPYPLPKSDHIALPDFSSGAMENWGLITYREECLLADPATSSLFNEELIATVIAHEVSHQWFGNLVTMKWWDDLWLNESFANVMEYRAVDDMFPDWHIWNSFIVSEGLSALRRDATPGVQSVKTPVHHPEEISALFDPSIVYAKGGRLLAMLMQYLGEADFRKGLRLYFEAHTYGNTTGDDLWTALSKASGKDVRAFMTPWLEQSGFPVVRVNQTGTNLQLEQSHFLLDPSKTDQARSWPVPLLSDHPDVPIMLEDTTTTSVVLSKTDYIQINKGAIGHYIVQYVNPSHMAAVADQAADKQLDTQERLMLLSDSSMLARSGAQSFADTLQLLERYAAEDSEPVWDIMTLVIADAKRFIDAAPQLDAAIKHSVRNLIPAQFQRLGWDKRDDESAEDTKLRITILALGAYSRHPEIFKHAVHLFESYKTDPTSVASELRGVVFGAGVRSNTDEAFEYLLQLDESTDNVDLRHEAMGALTLTESTERAKQLLARLKDKTKVRPQEVGRWVVYLLRNRHTQETAWKWLRDNWKWIEQTFGGDKSYDMYPRYAASAFNTPELVRQYEEFFAPMQNNPALSRNIQIGIEELASRVTWIQRDLDDVVQYFTPNHE